ncbi:MAG TPA: hypothetical protein VF950_11360 [Planctomycetota bacterium]
MKTRGAALVVVLASLALLALLAVTFATSVGTDRRIARNYLDSARARLLASSGVETAIDRLRALAGTGVLFDGRAWKPCGHPEGACEGGPEKLGDGTVEIRITDAHAKIHLNDGVAWSNDHAVSRTLQRVLNALGDQVRVPRLGDRVIPSRPPAGYPSVHDLPLEREEIERVRPFVAVRAWSDPDVANPVPFSEETGGAHSSPVRYDRPVSASGPVYRFGHQRNAKGELVGGPLRIFDPADPSPTHNAVWGLDSLNPRYVEIVARAPVNVNAAPREVLVALLSGLEGVFLVERRRGLKADGPGACGSPGGAYGWPVFYTYDGRGHEGDEAGLLYRTAPIPAEKVADAILAKRPFRSWGEFNAFCDGLPLRETRTDYFWDWDANGRRVPSEAQLAVASRAMADVLKANFNPNLHLNEINPDAPLFTHVDKTDLTVSSTELCFGPMGVFEIEAVGRVDGAVARAEVVVKTFDALRHTHQKHFSTGASGPRTGDVETNTNAAVESGPEVSNGPAAAENEYEGWLRPATIGSNLSGDERKPAGELRSTLSEEKYCPGATTSPRGGPHLGSGLHAHFEWDHVAHHHAAWGDLVRLPMGAWQAATARRCSLAKNWEDVGEKRPGPYGPVGGRRIARSWRGAPPAAVDEAPSDLRVDGAYAERGAAFGYWIEENESFNINEGTIAFWIKPAFDPRATGKRRTLISAGRYHATAPDFMNPSPFALHVLPSGEGETFPAYGSGALRPGALAFGFGFSPRTGYNAEFDPALGPASAHAFAFTPVLGPEHFRAHAWTHVAVTWKIPRRRGLPPDAARIYVNGRVLPGSETVLHRFAGDEGRPFENTPWWSLHSKEIDGRKVKNLLRIGGELSTLFPDGLFPGNFCADATIDELYVWLSASPRNVHALWSRGRFHDGGRFTSGELEIERPLAVAWTGENVSVALEDKRWTATFQAGGWLDDVTVYFEPPTKILSWVAPLQLPGDVLEKADAAARPFSAKARIERAAGDRAEAAAGTLARGEWRGPAVDPAMLDVLRLPWSELRKRYDVRVLEEPGPALKEGPSMAVDDGIRVAIGNLRARLDAATLRVTRVESATTVITLHGVRELNGGVSEERP